MLVIIELALHAARIRAVTAQIFWLKNRKPSEWRDKRTDPEAGKSEGVQILEDVPRTEN